MRELADRMPHRLVGNAFRTVPAMNVCKVNAPPARRARRRQRFDAVAQHHPDARPQLLERRT